MCDRVLRLFDRLAWAVRRRGLRAAVARALERGRPADSVGSYARWRQGHEHPRELARLVGRSRTRGVTVVVPLRGEPLDAVARCLASIEAQRGVRTDVVLAAIRRDVHPAELVGSGRHVRTVAGDDALRTALAGAEAFVALVDPGCVLPPHALAASTSALADGAEFVYGDEDRIDASGTRCEPFFKPQWSSSLLRSMNYLGRFVTFTRDLAERSGGLGEGEPHELALRLTERAVRVAHVPAVLHHVAQSARWDVDAAAQVAIRGALARAGEEAEVLSVAPGVARVRYALRRSPLVSAIIPTRDRVELLRRAFGAVLNGGHASVEVIVTDNGSTDPGALEFLSTMRAPHRVLPAPGPFNWSTLNNLAAGEARGELLLFLNNDVEAIDAEWLDELVRQIQQPNVGVVGAKLLYPDGAVQHAGVVLGMGGFAGHVWRGVGGSWVGPRGVGLAVREVSAVTGACMLVSRALFESLGGFDEKLAVAFNDVDFCLRAGSAGKRVVYTPHARLIHHESATREQLDPRSDYRRVQRRWASQVRAGDPHHPRNVVLEGGEPAFR